MKLWNNYLKELKIASRGFYFYMEIVMAADPADRRYCCSCPWKSTNGFP